MRAEQHCRSYSKLLYGIEVSYYSLIVCAHTVVNTVVTMANIEKNII
jgi:hypothetical protein